MGIYKAKQKLISRPLVVPHRFQGLQLISRIKLVSASVVVITLILQISMPNLMTQISSLLGKSLRISKIAAIQLAKLSIQTLLEYKPRKMIIIEIPILNSQNISRKQ
jgi:hypothetical protein